MRNFLICFILLLALRSASRAQSLTNVNWTFETNSNAANNPYYPNLTVGDVAEGPGLFAGSYIPGYSGDGFYFTGFDISTTTTGSDNSAFDSQDYFTFTLTPASNRNITVSGISIRLQRNSSGPGRVGLRGKIGSGTWTGNLGSVINLSSGQSNYTLATFSFSGFTNITAPVTFAIFGYGASDALNGELRIDELTFTSGTLPVALRNFEGRPEGNGIQLEWQTDSEQDLKCFDLEYSADGIAFQSRGQVPAVGNSHSIQRYSWFDERPEATTNYYRLKVLDRDEGYAYSPVVTVTVAKVQGLVLLANPVYDCAHLHLAHAAETPLDWQLLSLAGDAIRSGTQAPGITDFDVPMDELPGGVYFLSVWFNNKTVALKLMK